MRRLDRTAIDALRERALDDDPYVTRRELADLLFDLDQIGQERDDAIAYRDFLGAWYATRIERLRRLGREHGCLSEMSAILVNGTGLAGEPASYAKLLIEAQRRADKSEAEARRLRKK